MLRGLFALFLSVPSIASAATITVDVTDEELPAVTNGNCSLREAIAAANGDVAVDACVAGSGADEIVLANATYPFTAPAVGRTALPVVTDDLSVRGASSTLLIHMGVTPLRFFEVDAGATLTLEDVDLRSGDAGGEDGGMVLSRGTLVLTRAELNDGRARRGGAVYATGDVEVTESRFVVDVAAETGGALHVLGDLSISTTNFEDCALDPAASCAGCARDGGAIAALGPLTVEASTFLRNQASGVTSSLRPRGGAVLAGAAASFLNAVFIDDAALGADAEGSAIAALSTLSLTHCTFAGSPRITTADGGATLDVAGAATIVGTVLSHAGARALVPLCGALLTGTIDGSYFDDASCDGTDDGGAAINSRGLPVTGSPLVDAAPLATCPARDRDGASRPAGAGCDIGAYELGGSDPGFVVTTPMPTLTTDEAGATATFEVRLRTAPTAEVTAPVYSNDRTEVDFAPAMLVFDATNWSMPQTVTLTGQDDDIDDGDQTVRVDLLGATSTDPAYSGVFALGPMVTNLDDDRAAIVLSVDGATGEDGTTTTLHVRLGTQPLDVVTLVVGNDDATECATMGTLTFLDTDWSTEQLLTLEGVDDAELDGDVPFTVSIDPSGSADAVYAALAAAELMVTNLDDEVPDAGSDAGVGGDAGIRDAGGVDAGDTDTGDAGTATGSSGCACGAARAARAPWPALVLVALAAVVRRGRARRATK